MFLVLPNLKFWQIEKYQIILIMAFEKRHIFIIIYMIFNLISTLPFLPYWLMLSLDIVLLTLYVLTIYFIVSHYNQSNPNKRTIFTINMQLIAVGCLMVAIQNDLVDFVFILGRKGLIQFNDVTYSGEGGNHTYGHQGLQLWVTNWYYFKSQ